MSHCVSVFFAITIAPERVVPIAGEKPVEVTEENGHKCMNGCYEIKGGKVYWNPHNFGGPGPLEIEGSDSKSFASLNGIASLGSDKNGVYFEQKLVVGADPRSIQIVYARGQSDGIVNIWLRDKNSVFSPPFFEKLEGVSPDTFDYSYDPYSRNPYPAEEFLPPNEDMLDDYRGR